MLLTFQKRKLKGHFREVDHISFFFNFILWPYFISIPDTKWNNITGRRRTTQQLQTHTQRETMPCLNLSTNVPLDGVDTSSILSEATSTVANLIGKPEAVCSLSLSTGSVIFLRAFGFFFLKFPFQGFHALVDTLFFLICNYSLQFYSCWLFLNFVILSLKWLKLEAFCCWMNWNQWIK